MSDSVSNAQVQDVLSSIRRLVSEEGRAPKPLAPAEVPEPAGKLVLTPSLRVAIEEEVTAEAAQPQEPQGDENAEDVVQADAEVDSPTAVADAEAAETAEVEEAKPWPPADDDPCWEEFVQAAVEQEQATAQTAPSENSQDDWPEPSEDVAKVPEDAAETQDNESAALPLAETDADFPDSSAEEVNNLDEEAPASDPLVLDASMKDAPVNSPTETLAAKIAALEAVIGRTPDQWEPDGTGADDYSGTQVQGADWEEQPAEPEPQAEDVAQAPVAAQAPAEEDTSAVPPFVHRAAQTDTGADEEEDQAAEPAANAKDGTISLEEGLIDEDALRDLVGELVRQELQGALGERITRNVRKLVRREIQRALTAKELE